MLDPDKLVWYQREPVAWCYDHLGVRLWEKQEEILYALVEDSRVAVPSCHESGKTFVAACAVCWYITCFYMSRIVTTAPTDRQVRIVLWNDIRRMHRRLKEKFEFVGDIFQKEWRIMDGWNAIGFSTDDENAFQGLHSPYGNIMGIFDEATGISKQIFEQADGVIMGENAKNLLLGNPTAPNNYFHWCCEGKISGYRVIPISALDSPNIEPDGHGWYRNKKVMPFPSLVEMGFVNKMIKDYGIDSPQVRARVFGEFPKSAQDQLISNEMLAAALHKGVYLRKMVEMARTGEEIVPSHKLTEKQRWARK